MVKKDVIGVIVALVVIIGGLLAIFGFQSIPDLFKKIPYDNSVPFTVELSPLYFDEGNYDYVYDKIPFSIELNEKSGSNITYLELTKENFKVSRKDGELNKPFSSVNWKDSSSSIIFTLGTLNQKYYSYYSSKLKADGEMVLCKNCFIGTEYPYVFTFTIYYKEGEGELKSKTFNEEIPIK